MSIRNAISLLNDIGHDDSLRHHIYECTNQSEFFDCLKKNGYIFNQAEFEEAVTYLHVHCTTYAKARELFEKAEWLRYLLFIYRIESYEKCN